MAKDIINSLIKLSEEKILHLMRILDYTKKQNEVIVNENMERLEKYIEKKQKEIDIIKGLDDRFAEEYNKLIEVLKVDSLDEVNISEYTNIKRLKTTIIKITELLNSISEVEKTNKASMNENFRKLKGKLKKVKKGKKVTKGYNGYKNMQESIFFNKRK